MASIVKRKWKKPDGTEAFKWVVRYVAPDGSRPGKSFTQKKDAERYRLKVQTELENGTLVTDAAALTIERCCDGFIAHAEHRRAAGKIGESRLRIFKVAIDKHIVPKLGKKRITELTWADLEDWQQSMSHLGPRTREAYMVVFKMVEDYAIKRGYMKKPVVREFRRDVGSAKVAPIRTFSAEQASMLLRTVADRPAGKVRRVQAMTVCAVYLAACCGLRFGEIMGLTLANLDFERGVLKVRNNLTAWDLLKDTKTSAGRRDVPMPAKIGELLKAWLAEYYLPNDRELIFRSVKGGLVGQGNWKTHHWYPILKQAGLWHDGGDQFHFHALRHFAASWMIEHGLALPDVASLMGHSKFDMTLQVYAHPIIGGHRRHEAFERMTGALIATAVPLLPPQAVVTP